MSKDDVNRKTPMTRQETLETKDYLGEPGTPSGAGAAEGELARKKGSKDEMKRAQNRPAGATRVRKSDEAED